MANKVTHMFGSTNIRKNMITHSFTVAKIAIQWAENEIKFIISPEAAWR